MTNHVDSEDILTKYVTNHVDSEDILTKYVTNHVDSEDILTKYVTNHVDSEDILTKYVTNHVDSEDILTKYVTNHVDSEDILTKYVTNHVDSEDILTDQEKMKKGHISNTSDKPHTSKTLQKRKSMSGSEQPGAVSGRNPPPPPSPLPNKQIFQDRQLPISLIRQVMDQCVLPTMTYGCQTCCLK